MRGNRQIDDSGALHARLLVALCAPLAAGWLASGSCSVAACVEDCDPCRTKCLCETHCQHPQVPEAAHRIAAFDSRLIRDGEGRLVRVYTDVVGPSLALALGPGPHTAQDIALFAQGVLEVNAELFPTRPGARWVLDAVDRYETAEVVAFHQETAPASDGFRLPHAASASLLFDRAGSLLETSQVFER